jgi:hypothetical protein
MSTMKSKRRPESGAEPVEQPPEEAVDLLVVELLPERRWMRPSAV